jgi:hypothetical protein
VKSWEKIKIRVEITQMYAVLYSRSGSGSKSGLDQDSMGSLDPYTDPDSRSGSGSKRAKMTKKNRKQLINFIF